jgi:hypothetical protein
VLLKKTAGHPLVNGHSYHLSQSKHSVLLFIKLLCLLNSLEEESHKGLK